MQINQLINSGLCILYARDATATKIFICIVPISEVRDIF